MYWGHCSCADTSVNKTPQGATVCQMLGPMGAAQKGLERLAQVSLALSSF